jgi:cyclic beta-1,2-glucan synthetase
MKVTTESVFDVLLRLRDYFLGGDAIQANKEPFRSELFSSEQMTRHGKIVAQSHKLAQHNYPHHLLKRLHENEVALLEVRNLLVEDIRAGKSITPAAEWLLDNFYLIEEQVVIARKHLPKGYNDSLPFLEEGHSSGMPRVYDIVLEIISHSDGRVDIKNLSSFVSSYQSFAILTLGELWAIPIMLRLAVIENLRRVSGKIALGIIDHNFADYWADRMMATMENDSSNLILTIADMARSKPVLDSAFVAGFTRKLQGKGSAFALPLTWVEQQLSGLGTNSNDLVREENQKQATDQVSVSNSISTLRFIGATDWREFVETLSVVDQTLRQDPTGTYVHMDFATRDRYRHVIESVSKRSSLSETEVAEKVLELAGKHVNGDGVCERQTHLGYYLIDKGLKQTEIAAAVHYTIKQKLIGIIRRSPIFFYLLSITLLTGIIVFGLCHFASTYGNYSRLLSVIVTVIFISCAAHLSVSLTNWLSTLWVKPVLLPRMDFSKGIPPEYRTLVAIPTMLLSKAYIEELVVALEIRFLANRENNVHFCLLTDYVDADIETLPQDSDLLDLARKAIEDLNKKYVHSEYDIFFLFHRPRKWNEKEKKWMGYERKRGKLAALNAVLRGRNHNDFSLITGKYAVLTNVKFVITLDSDTRIPREAIWKLVATMAHPLNHAVYNTQKKRVTEGYGILQPRVASGMPTSGTSLYLRVQGDVAGIDPYTKVSSDVYQDLFGEGSFIGKGIYDVDIFERAVNNVFQENRILSHDLLEGCYARSGLVSDVLLYEDNPAQYATDIKRHYRWIRGDWQIGAWMLPFVTNSKLKLKENMLSTLSRWKIFDNLRRSLVPLSLILFLLSGWIVLPFSWFWTLSFTVIILLTSVIAAGWHLVNKPFELSYKAHLSEVGKSVRDTLIRFVFGIAVLPYEAVKYSTAIIRTNLRMIFTKKKLLEWAPSATSGSVSNNIFSIYASLWIIPFFALITGVWLSQTDTITLWVASPILALWLVAPAIVWLLNATEKEEDLTLPAEKILFLHKSARKIWAFFEQFVTEEENWLPPDNYQEQPVQVVAHRTSPTNMGLALLANLSAYDFGFITNGGLIEKCDNTLQTMCKLERFKGHFYNWYDTVSLQPLHPKYVSAVDSGNLAGHLMTLRQGLLGLPKQPVISKRIYEGLRTTVVIIKDLSKEHNKIITENILALLTVASSDNISLSTIKKHLGDIQLLIDELYVHSTNDSIEAANWTKRLSLQTSDIWNDLEVLTPWGNLPPIPERFNKLATLNEIPSLLLVQNLPEIYQSIILYYEQQENSIAENEWLIALRTALADGSQRAGERIALLGQMAETCEQLSDIDYNFLFDKSTGLLKIGYNVDEQRRDNGSYDLLASEARLGVFVGIAQGKLPQDSWFALGRLLTNSGGDPILLSWSGSMFEYLMPQLVMPAYEKTLLYQTNKATVKRQIEYAEQRGIPWGISESGYNMFDANLNYQYRAFGVPGLGLKRGLEEDLVIAPYASMLALMIAPSKACSNLQLLSKEEFEGEYGFFEAIDYTPSRLPRDKSYSIIKSYMVHHVGMSLLSLAYLLLDKPMQQRFMSELRFQATLLLLQERIPRAAIFYAHTADIIETHVASADVQLRSVNTANTVTPEIQLLGNGSYQVMVTNSGGGYSRWKDIAVTRWREDATKDNTGIFCYIKDVKSGNFWSNTYQPTLKTSKRYEAVFSQGHVEFRRHDDGIDTKTEIVISPEDDTEMRRMRLTNKTKSERVLEITSYAEVVLASQASDESHPAFSNLFVETEILPEHNAIYCTRRPRSAGETPPWMFHLMNVHGAVAEEVSYETDRMQFIGRGKNLAHPQAMETNVLSGKQGAVLDPIVSIRYRITIKPMQTVTVDLIYGISETKESCRNLMQKYSDTHLKRRAFELSWTHSQVLLRQINATEADALLYDRLAAAVIYANPYLRAEPASIQNNFRGQSGLWSHSVSGDLPIVLLHIHDADSLEIARQLVQAHAYWRLKGLPVDLMIWNEDHGSYRQLLQEQILGLITTEIVGTTIYNRPGKIFIKSADQISAEDRLLFESVARVVIHDNKGSLAEQVNAYINESALPPLLEIKQMTTESFGGKIGLPDDMVFFNSIGGFTKDGKEYKIITDNEQTTPAPWVNVIANSDFGTVVSENGSAYTWCINAHEYRITPWSNDPVSDSGGEAFYLRDEETGHFWSPSPFPKAGDSPYITTHGFGYTTFEHTEQGIATEMCMYVDAVSPVKFIVIRVKNESGRERKFSATGFLEMILGDVRSKTNMHVISEYDSNTGALLLRNRYNTPFAERVTFFKVNESGQFSFTADRSEFIGRNSNLSDPKALYRKKLSGRRGAGFDPCAALQVKFDLSNGAEKEIVFQLGNGQNISEAKILIQKFADRDSVSASLDAVKSYWKDLLGGIQIVTPDAALNILANGWLTYQTLACRIYARSGFYQSGGAFGFRDQLQDVLALLHTQPEIARTQILLCASRQFAEGDVQHWWHPPEGRGVRTRCSDDLLWLPFAVCRYVTATGDNDILNVPINFLEGNILRPDQDSLYDLPTSSNLSGSLYEHCVRAIKYSLQFGSHGLPLIGSGDWNDGMDRVGNKGSGESVWLGFFLYDILMNFGRIATNYEDTDFAGICKKEADTVRENLESSGWDGEWYRRAYFDDGTPLGSKESEECKIDAIVQSWSVLSGVAGEKRQDMAMAALDKYLVKREYGLIQLLDPPFDNSGLNPGYIRGYVPGVRENGGQYSHAAIWALMAFAKMGRRDKTWELFSMIHPINHTSDAAQVQTYKAEPYVMAADVYANESHRGRGGWTWYTGSAGWMYQFIISSMLGIEREADQLLFNPCFPLEWPFVTVMYHYKNAIYNLKIFQVAGSGSRWKIGDEEGTGNTIPLTHEVGNHSAEVYIQV